MGSLWWPWTESPGTGSPGLTDWSNVQREGGAGVGHSWAQELRWWRQGRAVSSDGHLCSHVAHPRGGLSFGAGREQSRQGAAILTGTAAGKRGPRSQSFLFQGVSEVPLWGPKDTHSPSRGHGGSTGASEAPPHPLGTAGRHTPPQGGSSCLGSPQVTCWVVWPGPQSGHGHPGAGPASRRRPAGLQPGPGSGGAPCAEAPAR